MRIAVEGRRAVILGDGGAGGAIVEALAAALAASGAIVDRDATAVGEAYLLVQASGGLGGGPVDADEVARFAAGARAWARGVERIVHVISAAGLVPLRGAAEASAEQAALASLTRALAMELAPVLVNAVAVGGDARMASHAALRRAGSAEEIARAALFLADPANTYTTGHVMAVDGGWSIGYARNF